MKNAYPEILAPVGGEEQLIAALRCGADAVYFGLQNFNARRNADNFNGENLKNTIRLCHEHSCRVYITINTVVFDDELEDVYRAVDTAALAGADALIIQDFAVAAYARDHYPKLKRFASTQMAVHNSEGVRALQKWGFDRVVLARELSLEEIRKIVNNIGADVEAFVHGAHCMSLSGNCYLSSMIGGRSGNRGLCAQPCRLDCEVCGRDHALSLKDMSYMGHIKELADAGVGSLKIEGRMKRAEYVAAAVTACKNAREGKDYDLDTLRAVFSRSGFTDGYLMGNRTLDMFGYRTKDDVTAASSDVLKSLAKLYEKETQTVGIDMFFSAKAGEKVTLTVNDGDIWVSCEGDVPQNAKTQPMTEESVRKNLGKLGGTFYYLKDLQADIEDGLMLPISSLNDLRRRAVAMLTDARVDAFEEY
ncbi:MAG: U32 family peptidase [Firmicutes bacterium]|nr:U32 family peptidase [Bacillota bacterium]